MAIRIVDWFNRKLRRCFLRTKSVVNMASRQNESAVKTQSAEVQSDDNKRTCSIELRETKLHTPTKTTSRTNNSIVEAKCPVAVMIKDAKLKDISEKGQKLSPTDKSTTQVLYAWPVVSNQDNKLSGDFYEYITDRLKELNPGEVPTDDKWAVAVVDFWDELRACSNEWLKTDDLCAKEIQKSLQAFIGQFGYRLIDSDKWNPNVQRAVSIVHDADAIEPMIVEKGATGLSRGGKLVRKQEVKVRINDNLKDSSVFA